MIVLVGSVGSGKTEQGRRLAKYLNCPWLSTSQLLRDKPSQPRHQQMATGELVADQAIIEVLEAEFKKIGAERNEFVLDGAPRSLAQSQWLLAKIKAGEVKFTAIVCLNVSKEEIFQRLADRQRTDDQKQVVLRRLEEYQTLTEPALAYLTQHGLKITEIDGNSPIEIVERRIHKALGIK